MTHHLLMFLRVQFENSTPPLETFNANAKMIYNLYSLFCNFIVSNQTYPVIVFVLKVRNILRDICQSLRHLILTTQLIILPIIKVKLGVI